MNTEYIIKAIYKLKPNAQFSFTDGDYSTIKWDFLDGKAPTQTEIDIAVEEIKVIEASEADAKAQSKAIAQAKLAALGLTIEDLTALGL